MADYEYKVIPAPDRAEKAKGLKTRAERFAHTLGGVLNRMARDGWDYLGTEALPVRERRLLGGSRSGVETVLVFRRPLPGGDDGDRAEPGRLSASRGGDRPPAMPRLTAGEARSGAAAGAPQGPPLRSRDISPDSGG